jgi:hypothetical protein
MPTDLEQLVVKMSADLSRFEKQMLKAQGVSNQAAGRIQKRFKEMNKGINTDFLNLGSGLKSAFATLSVEKVVSTMREVTKSIADIGDAADRLHLSTDEFQRLQFTAQLAGVEAETFANGMKKLALNSSEASRGQGDLGKLFAANGVSILDQNGKLLSQTQILQKVADLVQNAANEQDQNAIAVAAMGKAGADNLGLLAQGGDAVAAAFGKAATTPIFTEEQIRLAQDLDDKFDTLIRKVEVLGKQFVLTETQDIDRFFTAISDGSFLAGSKLEGLGQKLIDLYTYSSTHDIFGNLIQGGDAIDRLLAGSGNSSKLPIPLTPANADGKGSLDTVTGAGQLVRSRPPTIIPVDVPKPAVVHKPPTPKAAPGPNGYQQSVQQIQENIALLEAETVAVNANIFSYNGYDAAVKKAQISQGLLNDAKAAGVKITPELRANIDKLSASYVVMQEKLDAAKKQHDDFIQSVESMKALSKDVLGGFISDLKNGVDAVGALENAFGKIADKLIEIAVNNLVENAFGGALGGSSGGGGILSSLLGGLLGGGGGATLYAKGGVMSSKGNVPLNAYASGGVATGPQMALFGEGRQNEAYVPLPDGKSIPVAMKGSGSGGSTIHINISMAGANGNDEIARIARQQAMLGIREAQRQQPKADIERRLRIT